MRKMSFRATGSDVARLAHDGQVERNTNSGALRLLCTYYRRGCVFPSHNPRFRSLFLPVAPLFALYLVRVLSRDTPPGRQETGKREGERKGTEKGSESAQAADLDRALKL